MSPTHLLCEFTSSTETAITFTLRFSNSPFSFATMPSSVVQTGVKSFGCEKSTPQLLALSVVGLGAGMDLRVVARAGAHGFLYTIVSISCAIALGALFTRLFSAGRNIGALITVGTAICGGSAIAAVVPILRP